MHVVMIQLPEHVSIGDARVHCIAVSASTYSPIHTIAVDNAPDGYPRLATFLSSDRNFMQYRGFGYLHARLLLAVQHDIESLERELDELDRSDSTNGREKRLSSKTCDDIEARKEQSVVGMATRPRPVVLADLEKRLMAYGMDLRESRVEASCILTTRRPDFAESKESQRPPAPC